MILEILAHTPPWVFGLFVLLVTLGLLQARPRSVSRLRLALLPLGMVVLSFLGVRSSYGGDPVAVSTWLAAVLAVVALALFLPPTRRATYSAATGRFAVRGSWVPFALMMGIFFTKYAVAVARAVDPATANAVGPTMVVCTICGVCSGLFLARALRVARLAWPPGAGEARAA